MKGRKSDFLLNYCRRHSLEYVCFDYRGFGESKGEWAKDARISNWLCDTLWMIDNVVQSSKVILVGSSMGGWLALLATKQRPNNIAGLVLLAPAVDMTKYYPDPTQYRQNPLRDNEGHVYYKVANKYDNQKPYNVYKAFLDDGARYYLLDNSTSTKVFSFVPTEILHGTQDIDIPPEKSKLLMEKLFYHNTKATLTLVEGSDHRLSDPNDLLTLKERLNHLLFANVL
jgi:pimeloyl-ACP methyl ester carboxylesterase